MTDFRQAPRPPWNSALFRNCGCGSGALVRDYVFRRREFGLAVSAIPVLFLSCNSRWNRTDQSPCKFSSTGFETLGQDQLPPPVASQFQCRFRFSVGRYPILRYQAIPVLSGVENSRWNRTDQRPCKSSSTGLKPSAATSTSRATVSMPISSRYCKIDRLDKNPV